MTEIMDWAEGILSDEASPTMEVDPTTICMSDHTPPRIQANKVWGWTLKPKVTVFNYQKTTGHVRVFLQAPEGSNQPGDSLDPSCPSAELTNGGVHGDMVAHFTDGFKITEKSQSNCCFVLVFKLYETNAPDAPEVCHPWRTPPFQTFGRVTANPGARSSNSSANPQPLPLVPFSFDAGTNLTTFHTDVRFEGDLTLLGTQYTSNADRSEFLPSINPHEDIRPGMAIGWHFGEGISLTTTNAHAFGIVSSSPANVMNTPRDPAPPGHPVIFDQGQENLCVTKGPVTKGQGLYVVFGHNDGALVAADNMDPTVGIRVGIATADGLSDDGLGTVNALVWLAVPPSEMSPGITRRPPITSGLALTAYDQDGGSSQLLKPGSVVALHSPAHNRFIRMMGDRVDTGGGNMGASDLPEDWHSERFTVVDAGRGEVALHSSTHGRFVRMAGESLDAMGGTKQAGELPADWGSERFTVVDAGNGMVALHSRCHNRFVRVDENGQVDSKGGVRDADALPDAWQWERFEVRPLTAAQELADDAAVVTIAASASVGGVIGLFAAGPAVTATIAGMGFGGTGIAAGTTAASMMSASAIANGGGVAVASTVATLQSIGAVGLSPLAATGCAIAGAVVGSTVCSLVGGAAVCAYWAACKGGTSTQQRSHGARHGKWMVVTEEGIGNIRFYPFETEAESCQFFRTCWCSRARLDPSGKELETGGWNPLAINNIRRNYGGSSSNSRNGFRARGMQPGSVVALHSPAHNRFIRMMGDRVDTGGGNMGASDLPEDWHSERFTVVDAGRGEVALHSSTHGRFVRMAGESLDAIGGTKQAGELPADWGSERFTVVDAGNGMVALHSRCHNRFVRVDENGQVDSKGGVRDADALPDAWQWERFEVRPLTAAKLETMTHMLLDGGHTSLTPPPAPPLCARPSPPRRVWR
eukprot:CAMPEP_0198231974 /NCGR_PEP_ID=MMETSP1445-20131203/115483_1 /TAXON_ID=36898 /ORGANISM="Pyramimonas sp., Strain CCMP2087" /LENGTH=926 /DNA_ID=CAMNT_0043912617 /DNA_START=110 /DNA_END=2887 /DNA_ORIENTATION=-